jgi:Ca2+-binding EF-hand superfamily protein
MHTKLYAVFAIILCGTALATNDEDAAATQARFEALDRNADQRISKSEAASDKDLAGRFAAVDSDTDGYLTQLEFVARPSGESFE